MNAAILNGALSGDDYTDRVAMTLEHFLHTAGWTATNWTLRDEKIAYCLGCFECWTKTPGICRIDDTGCDVPASIIRSDLTIYLTPVTFGGYSSTLKKAVDRIICLISPFFARIDGEVHHAARYDRYPALVGIGVLAQPNPAQEQVFTKLVQRNAINMHAPAHDSQFIYRGTAYAVNAAAATLQTILASTQKELA